MKGHDSWAQGSWEASHGAWLKRGIPYKPEANALQTLDVWIPREPEDSTPPSLSTRAGPWVVFIHGGAWRDPKITSTSFDPTVKHLLKGNAVDHLGGIASLNYSLSPHPDHPSHGSDPSRMAVHPDHIHDVLWALSFLQDHAAFGSNYVLAGHSCGAMLAFQSVMASSAWFKELDARAFKMPRVILGLNGLYDLRALVEHPGSKHEGLIPAYETFTKQAFGEDRLGWVAASPTSEMAWSDDWKVKEGGTKAILAQSLDDSLVPYSQTGLLITSLKASSKAGRPEISEVQISGDHNEIWEEGDRLAEILLTIVSDTWDR